jgi:hypothetical protein
MTPPRHGSAAGRVRWPGSPSAAPCSGPDLGARPSSVPTSASSRRRARSSASRPPPPAAMRSCRRGRRGRRAADGGGGTGPDRFAGRQRGGRPRAHRPQASRGACPRLRRAPDAPPVPVLALPPIARALLTRVLADAAAGRGRPDGLPVPVRRAALPCGDGIRRGRAGVGPSRPWDGAPGDGDGARSGCLTLRPAGSCRRPGPDMRRGRPSGRPPVPAPVAGCAIRGSRRAAAGT